MGGSPTYVYRDGQRLAPMVAYDFDRMAADYFRDIGYHLHVAEGGGLRFVSEQLDKWNAYQRYLSGGPFANLAAHPSDPKAYHVETNPKGGRAIDIYDDGPAGIGPSAGVGPGHEWMLAHAHEYGFENEGMGFPKVEPWHKLWKGADPWATPPASEPKEDEMSIKDLFKSFAVTGGQKVKGSALIYINDKRDVSVATGPAASIAGNLSVTLKAKPGSVIQIIPIVTTFKDGAPAGQVSLGADEVVATNGNTFAKVPVNCALAAGQRLRFQINGEATVIAAAFRGTALN
jgi:hypothetical protein